MKDKIMILELANVFIQDGMGEKFEAAITESNEKYISQTDGFVSFELQRGIEDPNHYILLIQWATLEAHTVNFRESDVFAKHRALISPYFSKAPEVSHFAVVEKSE
jgi:heme-degrading monooxygenase HmoA